MIQISPETSVIWLTSYPKSGNTWLRFLLYNSIYGKPESSIAVTRRIPDIHRSLPFDPPGDAPLFIKTHFALSPNHPLLAQTVRAIHILRHPKDILLSALNYRRLTGTTTKQLTDRAYASAFIQARGDPEWASQGFGDWPGHTESWMAVDQFPVLTIYYEQLKQSPAETLHQVLEFLEIDADGCRVEAAAKASSFDQLRALEVREKTDKSKQTLDKRLFIGDPSGMRAGHRFMNTGKTGQTLAHIAKDLDARFDTAFANELGKYGY